MLVRGLRGLRLALRWALVALRWFAAPLHATGYFLFRHVFVQLYRLVLIERLAVRRVLALSKNWIVFLIANRYVVHGAVAVLTLAVSASSVLAQNDQGIETGNKTPLFALLSSDEEDSAVLVQEETPPIYRPAGVNYLGNGVARAAHFDFDYEAYTPIDYRTVGQGSAVLAPSGQGTARSLAPRERVIEYTVEAGDSVGSIAADYGLSVRTILWANNLGPRDYIRLGDKLKILPVDGVLHMVKSGDTLEKISKRYGADSSLIVAANPGVDSEALRLGETIVVPGGAPPAPKIARVPPPLAPIGSIFRPPAADANRSTRLLWPTTGHVITQYFGGWEHVRGWRVHTGIDIDGDYSSPIYAADDGIVLVAGWNKGYGLMVDIDHGEGKTTRYGHSSKLFVKPGQYVKRGEVIAMIGSTGYSTGTHVHFEVRLGGRAVNPIPYLR